MDEKRVLQKKNDQQHPAIQTRGRVLTLTVGLPASGKTTWAKSAGFDQTLSLDDCREALWDDRTLQNGPGGIEALLYLQDKSVDAAIAKNQSIAVHNTNLLKAHRRPLIERAKQNGYRTQIVYFDIPKEECLRRNRKRKRRIPDEVIEDFDRRMEVPEAGEADKVVYYSDLN